MLPQMLDSALVRGLLRRNVSNPFNAREASVSSLRGHLKHLERVGSVVRLNLQKAASYFPEASTCRRTFASAIVARMCTLQESAKAFLGSLQQ